MTRGSRILLVEDSPSDVEVTLPTLKVDPTAVRIDVARDETEALDYIVKPPDFRQLATALRLLSAYWLGLNQPARRAAG